MGIDSRSPRPRKAGGVHRPRRRRASPRRGTGATGGSTRIRSTSASADPARRAAGEVVLEDLLRRRLRVCRELGIRVPRALHEGARDTLLWRAAQVDRRIVREMELRGGAALPAWRDEPSGPEDDDEEGSPCPV